MTLVEFKRPPRAARTQMETMLLDLETVGKWQHWPGQRPIRINDKVRRAAEEMVHTETINGMITLGLLDTGTSKASTAPYLLDGQHRVEAFKIADIPEALADVRICHFDTMAEMGEEFVKLNSALVSMRPDDILRGLEASMGTLLYIRKNCDFVGYDSVRRSPTNPIISMSALLRCWFASGQDTPAGGGKSATNLAHDLTQEDAEKLVVFLQLALSAWGRDPQYWRLYGALNITLCMWLWRLLVLDTKEGGLRRTVVLKPDMFRKCLMSLSADSDYVDWLLGRLLSERDRSPCYTRIKSIFAKRLRNEHGGQVLKLPQPPWSAKV